MPKRYHKCASTKITNIKLGCLNFALTPNTKTILKPDPLEGVVVERVFVVELKPSDDSVVLDEFNDVIDSVTFIAEDVKSAGTPKVSENKSRFLLKFNN